jgi:signal transduction histidine kinase
MINSTDAMKDVDGTRELTIQSQLGEDGRVLISVSDTDLGLPPQLADKIFNALFATKTHGTGTGLRISRSIVESHGGRLWAADNSPRGARSSRVFTALFSPSTSPPLEWLPCLGATIRFGDCPQQSPPRGVRPRENLRRRRAR